MCNVLLLAVYTNVSASLEEQNLFIEHVLLWESHYSNVGECSLASNILKITLCKIQACITEIEKWHL